MSRPKGVMHPITVQASKDSQGRYHFRPESDLWDEARDEFAFSKDRHNMHSRDFHLLEFALDDRTGDGLKFPPVPHDAMWVTEGHEDPGARNCPDMNSVCNYEVMEPMSVSPDGKRLFVRNDNPRKEHWVFTINFVKQGQDASDRSKFVSWDPGGNNQNGGTGHPKD